MARRTQSRNELIKCEYCGEMYSTTYKRCPFCNGDGTGRWDDPDTEFEDGYDDNPRRGGGGKRLPNGRKGPSVGRIIGAVISLLLIVAAICIVVSIVRSVLSGGKDPDVEPSQPPVVETVAPVESAAPDTSLPPAETVPAVVPTAVPTATPAPTVQPAAGKPTGFTLNHEDFTMSTAGETVPMKAIFTPAGAKADVVWKSSDPKVAFISAEGVVTGVSRGNATITATVAGVGEKTCIVRCSFDGTAQPDQSSSGNLKLSREDFTLEKPGASWRLVVSGTSSPVTWAVKNSAVATVSGDGTVTAVSAGKTTVTATVDGVTLKCIVRCTFD